MVITLLKEAPFRYSKYLLHEDSKKDLSGSDANSQLDLLVKYRDALSSTPHDWSQVRVVKELIVSKPSNQKLY